MNRNLFRQTNQFFLNYPQNHQSSTSLNNKQLRHCQTQRKLSTGKNLILKQTQIRIGQYKYNVEQMLGRGYSSKVYKGTQIDKPYKKYAIKIVEVKKFKGNNLSLLQTEIQIHKSLDSQYIVKCYDVIKTAQFWYIILEYCPHGNLMDYISQKKKLTEFTAIEIMDQVLEGYKYLLDIGIIHRDLKPANILRIGNKWKISDFGFSTRSKFQFKDRMNVGTPLYMSSQSLKSNIYSYKTDLFSLGVILYEMLFGKTPWQCRTQDELLEKMKNEPINLTVKDIKSQLIRNFIFRCCTNQQSKRFSQQQFMKYTFIESQISKKSQKSQKSFSPDSDAQQQYKLSSIASSKNLTGNCHNTSYKSFRSSGATEESSSKSFIMNSSTQKQNSNALSNELDFCHLLHSIIENIQSFLLKSQENKKIFVLTVYKHLIKIMKSLEQQSKKATKSSPSSSLKKQSNSVLLLQIKQFGIKYQKQYLDYVKQCNIQIIRSVNRRFPQLSSLNTINAKFYEQISRYLSQCLREQNHEISILMTERSTDFNGKIQALDALYQYFKIIGIKKQSMKQSKQIPHQYSSACEYYNSTDKDSIDPVKSVDLQSNFQKITFLNDYKQSKMNEKDYQILRKNLKYV